MVNINLTLRTKLMLAFSLLTTLVIIMSLSVYNASNNVNESVTRLLDTKFPMAQTAQNLQSELNISLASLRGQIILGNDPQERARFLGLQQTSWNNIEQLSQTLKSLLKDTDISSNRFRAISDNIRQLQSSQNEVSQIANSEDNQPALKMLVREAIPLADQMLKKLEAIVELEFDEDADEERRDLLINLAISRSSFAISIGQLRAFLLTKERALESSFNENWLKNADAYEVIVDDYEELLNEEQTSLWEEYTELREQFAPLTIIIFETHSKADANIANYLLATKIEPQIEQVQEQIQQLMAEINKTVLDSKEQLNLDQQSVIVVNLVVSAIVVIISILINVYISGYVDKNIHSLMERSFSISAGNLEISDDKKLEDATDEFDRLNASFNAMSHALSSMIKNVKGKSLQSEHSSHQVAVLAHNISSVAQHERQNYSAVMQAMESFNDLLNESRAIVNEAQTELHKSIEQAEDGVKAVNNNLIEMDKSVDIVQSASEKVASLREASEKISTVTGSINDVADQTNLISLNAAIEAARAGEHGRGFAVVAEEVRNLAKRTSESTNEIEDVIAELRDIVTDVHDTMSDIISQVDVSKARSEESGSALKEMMQTMDTVVSQNHNVVARTNNQMEQMGEIREKLVHLFQSLEENSEKANLVNQISENLNELVEAVNYSLSHFEFDKSGFADAIYQNKNLEPIRASLRVIVSDGEKELETITYYVQPTSISVRLVNGKESDLFTDEEIVWQQNQSLSLSLYLPQSSLQEYENQTPMQMNGNVSHVSTEEGSTIYEVSLSNISNQCKEVIANIYGKYG